MPKCFILEICQNHTDRLKNAIINHENEYKIFKCCKYCARNNLECCKYNYSTD